MVFVKEEKSMGYCGRCGEQLIDGVKFCGNCGKNLGEPGAVQPVSSGDLVRQCHDLRNQSMQELGRMYQYFGTKSDLYDEYDYQQSRYESLMGPGKETIGVVGTVLCAIGALGLAFILLLIVVAVMTPQRRPLRPSDIVDCSILIGIPVLVFAVGLECRRRKAQKDRERAAEQSRCGERISEIATELTKYYYAYGPCLIGIEYSNPKIISSIASVIRSGRANTPMEAINRMLEDAHMNYMQVQAEITSRAARQAASSAEVAAGAAVVAIGSFISPRFFIAL